MKQTSEMQPIRARNDRKPLERTNGPKIDWPDLRNHVYDRTKTIVLLMNTFSNNGSVFSDKRKGRVVINIILHVKLQWSLVSGDY